MVNWIKNNRLSTFLGLVAFYFIYQFYLGASGRALKTANYVDSSMGSVAQESAGLGISNSKQLALPTTRSYTPQADVSDRLVIQESNLSLLVKDVVETRNKILDYTTKNGGYMVNVSTTSPEETTSSTVVVRVPASKLQETLDYFHSLSIKVVSENLVGRDVTDQYVDIDTRISQIERSKSRLETILNSATEVSDITMLTQQILNYQNQIDSYIGQQESLKKNAELAKVTIYLSTDEVSLPYVPDETFRPNVIFKLAVRSLVRSFRNIAQFAIWVGVYAVIWIPLFLIYIFVSKWWKNRKKV